MDEIQKHGKYYEGQGTAPAADAPKGRFAGETAEPAPAESNIPTGTDNFPREVAHVDPAPLGGKRIQIKAGHSRGLRGQNISVAATAGESDLFCVRVTLDGDTICCAHVSGQSYNEDFHATGDGGPGMKHALRVEAWGVNGKDDEVAEVTWEDEI